MIKPNRVATIFAGLFDSLTIGRAAETLKLPFQESWRDGSGYKINLTEGCIPLIASVYSSEDTDGRRLIILWATPEDYIVVHDTTPGIWDKQSVSYEWRGGFEFPREDRLANCVVSLLLGQGIGGVAKLLRTKNVVDDVPYKLRMEEAELVRFLGDSNEADSIEEATRVRKVVGG